MKAKMLLLFLLLFLIVKPSQAQSLSESLGGIKTNFEFFSDSINLDVKKQFIIKNASMIKNADSYGLNSAYGYGGGYESFHLEFSTNKEIVVNEIRKPEFDYQLLFYNHDEQLISTIDFSLRKRSNHNKVNLIQHNEMKFFSFDLIYLPLSVLEETKRIEVKKTRKN